MPKPAAVRTSKPGRPRSVESERSILDAATSLLLERGFQGLTLDRVATRARAGKATIYRRWPTKEHLLVAVASRWPGLQAVDRGNALEELCDLHAQLLLGLHSPELRGLFSALATARLHDGALASVLDPLLEQRREPVREVLRRAVARGELPPEADIEAGLDALLGVSMMRLHFAPGDLGLGSMRRIFKLVLRGLGGETKENR
jgi:AcrR family transcriptional regulator